VRFCTRILVFIRRRCGCADGVRTGFNHSTIWLADYDHHLVWRIKP
jgi:hypothetical protein